MMKMANRRKAAKLKTERDHLTELPDEVLSEIISMLTFKEAVRTSILSKRWRYVWINHPDLLFDSINILGSRVYFDSLSCCQPEHERQLQRNKFAEEVDHVIHQRWKGLKIDSLSIHFHLGRDFASYINKWIHFAVGRGVLTLNLDLSERCSFKVADVPSRELELYIFPSSSLSSPGKRCTLKNLQLAFCCLSPLPSSSNLASLLTVELRDVNIGDQQLEIFLSACLCLQTLTLHFCNDLVNFKFSCPSSQLKLLRIQDCLRLKSTEVNSEYLAALDYTGGLVSFYFKNAPKLAKVFLNFTGETRVEGVSYALSRIAYDMPQLQSLNVLSVLAMKTLKLPVKVPSFSNIKQLILTVFPFHDEDKLQWINYILEAFPLLQELELNLFSPSYIQGSKEIDRHLPECSHRHLRKLDIYGFHGNQHEIDLLIYLLDSIVLLEVLVINLRQKKYKGSNFWEFEDATSWYRLRLETLGWLHEVVPPAIQLKIQ